MRPKRRFEALAVFLLYPAVERAPTLGPILLNVSLSRGIAVIQPGNNFPVCSILYLAHCSRRRFPSAVVFLTYRSVRNRKADIGEDVLVRPFPLAEPQKRRLPCRHPSADVDSLSIPGSRLVREVFSAGGWQLKFCVRSPQFIRCTHWRSNLIYIAFVCALCT